MDHAGAIVIGTAILLLFRTLLVTFAKRARIDAALRQHHAAPPPSPGVLDRVSAFAKRLEIPPKLLIGLSFGALSVLLPFATRPVASAFAEVFSGGESSSGLSRAMWLAGKWSVIGFGLQRLRRWGLGLRTAAAGRE